MEFELNIHYNRDIKKVKHMTGIKTIMIADDDPDIREVVKILLESEGFHVTEAVDGEERKYRPKSIFIYWTS